MGARGCLGPLLLLLLLPWAGGSGVGSESLPGAVAAAGGDRMWLQPSIIGGHEAKRHSRPYMAFLQIGGSACGAALLHRRWALTAAHCLPKRLRHKGRLLVGLHNRRDGEEEEGAQSFSIRAACPHPGYDSYTRENDLLLLQLDGKVTLSRTRRLIPLASREPAPGARCSLAGWGIADPRHGGLSPTLQELDVTVMDTRMCNNSRFWHGEIGPTMICFQGLRRGSAPAKVRIWGSKGAEKPKNPEPGCGRDAHPEQVGCSPGHGGGFCALVHSPVSPPLRVTRGDPWCAGGGRRWPASSPSAARTPLTLSSHPWPPRP
ncbi:granzyme M-like isoform X1 [Melospiza georgiana]|uniref:granzyme M-like isoform X1 n=1 Tax=Melospiza georgiana TaxID=44398 RepID=UPI0025ACC1A6|nr:granzyme M-like isoform X1 [Melospiza georgiana]